MTYDTGVGEDGEEKHNKNRRLVHQTVFFLQEIQSTPLPQEETTVCLHFRQQSLCLPDKKMNSVTITLLSFCVLLAKTEEIVTSKSTLREPKVLSIMGKYLLNAFISLC